jgi:hypothetical protein
MGPQHHSLVNFPSCTSPSTYLHAAVTQWPASKRNRKQIGKEQKKELSAITHVMLIMWFLLHDFSVALQISLEHRHIVNSSVTVSNTSNSFEGLCDARTLNILLSQMPLILICESWKYGYCSEHGPICHLFELILVIHANTSNGTNHIV